MDRILHFKSQANVPLNSRHTTLPILDSLKDQGDSKKASTQKKEPEDPRRAIRNGLKNNGPITKDNFAFEEVDTTPKSSDSGQSKKKNGTPGSKQTILNFSEKTEQNEKKAKKTTISENGLNLKKRDMFDLQSHKWNQLIFSPNVAQDTFMRHLNTIYRGLVYSKKCLKSPSDKFIESRQVCLVDCKDKKAKTLFLDLDETLVHSCLLNENPQNTLKTLDDAGDETMIGLNIRPYLEQFLESMAKYYEIFVFTASSPNYATSVVNFIDPKNRYINGILTRQNCMETKNGFFIKDLRIIKNRSLKNIIIVDNLSHSFGFQIDSGVPILEFHNDKKDSELKYLAEYLLKAYEVEDVRLFNQKYLKLDLLSECTPEELGLQLNQKLSQDGAFSLIMAEVEYAPCANEGWLKKHPNVFVHEGNVLDYFTSSKFYTLYQETEVEARLHYYSPLYAPDTGEIIDFFFIIFVERNKDKKKDGVFFIKNNVIFPAKRLKRYCTDRTSMIDGLLNDIEQLVIENCDWTDLTKVWAFSEDNLTNQNVKLLPEFNEKSKFLT